MALPATAQDEASPEPPHLHRALADVSPSEAGTTDGHTGLLMRCLRATGMRASIGSQDLEDADEAMPSAVIPATEVSASAYSTQLISPTPGEALPGASQPPPYSQDDIL